MTRVGFIGLGSQGAPMARRIVDAGFPTVLWARRPESLEPFSATSAEHARSRAALGASVDLLCVCVVDDDGVDEVLRGPDGALVDMAPGSVVAVHSTVHPTTCRQLQRDFPQIYFVDAPVSGGGDRAAAGELVVMVGGPEVVVERCRRVFETYGDPVVRVGELGTGLLVKLLNNTLFTAQLALAAEVYEHADRLGVDQGAVARLLAEGSGQSYAAGLVAMVGFSLDELAAIAAPLLAKDVAILAANVGTEGSTLLETAKRALTAMDVVRGGDGEMNAEDRYRDVMQTDSERPDTLLEVANRAFVMGEVWSRPGLSTRDRRFVTLPCVYASDAVHAIDAHIYAALASGDLSIVELRELTLHFAVYCGWPKASQVEMSVRAQWQRLHERDGRTAPPWPELTVDDLGWADPAERIEHGVRSFEEINLLNAPPPDSPYFYAGILNFVFGHLWQRPGLTRRERRLVTISCVGVSDASGPIWSHVTSALGSGDITYEEMEEVALQFSAYSGFPKGEVLQAVASQWKAANL